MAELVLTPEKGRVGHSRQVPAVVVDSSEIQLPKVGLNDVVERAFHKYTKHGVYSFIVQGDDRNASPKVFLYCNRTDKRIATIHITTKEN